MTHGSLFSGIGGFDLAAHWVGWENKFYCEINEFCQKILSYHFPNSKSYTNIKKTDFNEWKGRIDVLSGGFPCQPFSSAGKRRGTEDDRYLWDEMLRAINEIRPSWVVGENVAGILSMVQPSQEVGVESEGDKGEESDHQYTEQIFVLESIIRDLNDIGYNVQTFVIPACAVGAPHRRDRVWIVADTSDTRTKSRKEWEKLSDRLGATTNPNSERSNTRRADGDGSEKDETERMDVLVQPSGFGKERSSSDTNSPSIERQPNPRQGQIQPNGRDSKKIQLRESNRWRDFPTQPPICGGDDGLPRSLDGITFSQWRRESIKAYGNAIVPQVAYEIFKAIDEIENT